MGESNAKSKIINTSCRSNNNITIHLCGINFKIEEIDKNYSFDDLIKIKTIILHMQKLYIVS